MNNGVEVRCVVRRGVCVSGLRYLRGRKGIAEKMKGVLRNAMLDARVVSSRVPEAPSRRRVWKDLRDASIWEYGM